MKPKHILGILMIYITFTVMGYMQQFKTVDPEPTPPKIPEFVIYER
jgi:hypothetical protein